MHPISRSLPFIYKFVYTITVLVRVCTFTLGKINYANTTAAAPVLFCIALFSMKWFGSKRE